MEQVSRVEGIVTASPCSTLLRVLRRYQERAEDVLEILADNHEKFDASAMVEEAELSPDSYYRSERNERAPVARKVALFEQS